MVVIWLFFCFYLVEMWLLDLRLLCDSRTVVM